MRCEYCDVEVTTYPDNGICVCCGGRLPPREVPRTIPVQPAYSPTRPRPVYIPGIHCCPKCHNTNLQYKKQVFSWPLGILGFFLIPVLGLLLGLCGKKKFRITCANCGHSWKRN